MRRSSPLLRAARTARPLRWRLAASVALAAVAVGAGVALLATSGYLISRAAEQPPILALTVTIVGVRFFALSRALARYGERLASHDVALRVLVEERVAFLRRLLPLVPARLPRGGDAVSAVVADVDALQHLFVRALAPPVVAAVVVVGSAVAAGLALPAAGAVVLVVLVAAGIGVPALSVALTRRANRRQAATRAALAVEVTEAIAAAPELVALGLGTEQRRRVREADAKLQRLVRRDALGTALADAVAVVAAWGGVIAVLLVAVPAVGDGRLDGVLLASLALLALGAYESVAGLPAAAQGIVTTSAAAARLEEVAPPSSAAGPVGGGSPPAGPLRIAARGLSVRPAPESPPVLHDVDLTLAPGERVALVGPSGCGKSTLLRALVGMLPAEHGVVTVSDVDLTTLDVVAVRERVRLVEQDAHLFATSVAENVRLARPHADDDAVRAALERAGLGPWLETLPGGLDTLVGDDGSRLSGGQRQRIGLARGLLVQADLLLVDEPTSHLDDDAADSLLDDLLGLPDVGVLVTTHRMAGIERFDRVVVLREGRVVEHGAPQELLERGGALARMAAAAAYVEG